MAEVILRDVVKTYGEVVAVDRVTLTVEDGHFVALVGPSGCGKTTTLKLLMRLIFPTSGSARILGHDIQDVSMHQRIGYLPENPYFYDYLTAREFLDYCAEIFGLSAAQRKTRTADLLARVKLDEKRWDTQLRKFSKGMLQRVGLAQSLVNDPEIVFLDEPMSGLDPAGRHDVRQLIVRLRDEGRTVLLSSHILTDAELLCTRVGILSRGRVVALGSLSELTAGAARGWEIVVDGLSDQAATALGGRVRRVTRIAGSRYTLELPSETRPEPLVGDLAAWGAALVSVTPLRATLEEFFLQVSQ